MKLVSLLLTWSTVIVGQVMQNAIQLAICRQQIKCLKNVIYLKENANKIIRAYFFQRKSKISLLLYLLVSAKLI